VRIPNLQNTSPLRVSAVAICSVLIITGIFATYGGRLAHVASRVFDPSAAFLSLSTLVTASAGIATQVTVLAASTPLIVAPPGAEINIEANFTSTAPLPEDDSLVFFVVDAQGREVARVENNLNNDHTLLPTSSWVGPITFLTSMPLPKLRNGSYSLMLGLYKLAGPIQMTPGPGVTQDAHVRYKVGTLKVEGTAPDPPLLPPPTLDLAGYHLTFDEPFATMSLSDSAINDGARWYARNDECCMSTTDGTSTAMAGWSSPRTPFSKVPGGGLNIRLQRRSNAWTSGVLTSVDSRGEGFSQQYGYFEMKARFPEGYDTWPAFWLLNTTSKSVRAPAGEIDIVEYIANPGFRNYIATTLHDWSNHSAPAASHHRVALPTNGFHTYGMLWTSTTMTFYFDGAVTMRAPTPSIMKQPYYLLVDLGIGSGWPTEHTPYVNDMQVEYIRVYAT
jgi:beta-glucanase (GH16 family)